jgi:hypothetical protein
MLPRWLISFRALALASAFAAAFVPIATYITDDKRDWLWIHIGVNIAAYVAVALTTIYTTISLTQQDHNKYRVPAYWANNVVMRTWYLGVKKTWRWHAAAAVGRLGLALAVAQHVHSTTAWGSYTFYGILSRFYYSSGVYITGPYEPSAHDWMLVRSEWFTVIFSFVILIGFAWLETGLLSAFALMSRSFAGKNPSAIAYAALGRLCLIIAFISIMSFVLDSTRAIGANYYKHYSENRFVEANRTWRQIAYRDEFKHWFEVAFPWLDDGTMVAAQLLRPLGPYYECLHYDDDLHKCLAYETSGELIKEGANTFATYATYILAIIASLQLAHYLHWRREQGMNAHAPTDASSA